jgi:hypothetical protein
LLNSGLGYSQGYGNHGYSSNGGYGGYSGYGGLGGAVSHVTVTKEVTPSVGYTTGYAGHGYTGAQGYSGHGYTGTEGYASGYNLGTNYNGYNHAISAVSQHNVHASPSAINYGSYAPSAYVSYQPSYGNYAYGNKAW